MLLTIRFKSESDDRTAGAGWVHFPATCAELQSALICLENAVEEGFKQDYLEQSHLEAAEERIDKWNAELINEFHFTTPSRVSLSVPEAQLLMYTMTYSYARPDFRGYQYLAVNEACCSFVRKMCEAMVNDFIPFDRFGYARSHMNDRALIRSILEDIVKESIA